MAMLLVLFGCQDAGEIARGRLEAAADEVRGGATDRLDVREFGELSDDDLSTIVGLTELRSLNIDGTRAGDRTILKVVEAIPQLESLSASQTETTDQAMMSLRQLET